jgi:polysaccharide biosynthesis/export protein
MQRIRRSPALKRRRLFACATAFVPVAVAACSPGANLPALPDYNGRVYRLGGGDQVRIITFNVDQLSQTFRVNDSGNLALPLLGSVHAAGLTTGELGTRIARELQRKSFVRDASVSVEVAEYRPVFVLGEVNKPGQYPYLPGMTALTAVAVAGGFTYRAVQDYAEVVRSSGDTAMIGKVSPESFIAPGDVVKVLEQRF